MPITAKMGEPLTVEDITRWWGHIDRAAEALCPHYARHFCHYLQKDVSSLSHGLVGHEAAACMQDMAGRLGLSGQVQSKDELLRNLYYGHVCFAKTHGFVAQKALVVFNLLMAHHESSSAGLRADESRAALHAALLGASGEGAEGARLTLEDVKALVVYYQPLYFDNYELFTSVFGPEEGAVVRDTAVNGTLKRIERPPTTKRVTPDGVETTESTGLLPPLAAAMPEAAWLEQKRRAEQAVLDAEKARKEEEKRQPHRQAQSSPPLGFRGCCPDSSLAFCSG